MNAREYVNTIKRQLGGCQRCGYFDEEYLSTLEFDHLRPEEKCANISTLCSKRNVTKEELDNEIAKCRLLCAICHRKRTAEQWNERRKERENKRKKMKPDKTDKNNCLSNYFDMAWFDQFAYKNTS